MSSTVVTSATGAELVSSDARSEVWQTPRGTLTLRWIDGALLVRGAGHGDARLTAPGVRRMDEQFASGPIRLFFEFWDMPTYDSQMRTEWTGWLLRHRSRLESLHVLARSKLVLMGVSVANLALGGIVKTHETTATFERALHTSGFPPS